MGSTLSLSTAFITGILTFFSPCVLPLLPVFFSIMAGSYAVKNKKTLLVNTSFFILGFATIFILLGLSITAISHYLLFNKELIVKIAGTLVVFFGLFLMGVFEIPFLMQDHRKQINVKSVTPLSAFFLGVAFSLGWTPCIGPVLSSVLIMASSAKSIKIGSLLLVVFTLGFAIPFLVLSLFADKATKFLKISSNYLPYIQKISGGILIVMGVLLFTNQL